MQKHNKKLYTGIFIAIIFTIIVLFFIHPKEKEAVPENLITAPDPLLIKEGVQATPSKPKAKNLPLLSQGGVRSDNSLEQENTQSVTILTGDTITNLPFTPNTFFYNALVQGKNDGKIEFTGKNYPGLGFFVTDIGTLHSGNGKHLLYYINGKEATVGVSSYLLKVGDIIEWKLE